MAKREKVIFFVIGLLVGVIIGVMIGLNVAFDICADLGMRVLERSGFELDPILLQDIIVRYGKHI